MKASVKVKVYEFEGQLVTFGENAICKTDVLNMLGKELEVCRAYNIGDYLKGLEVAYTTVNSFPMESKSDLVRAMIVSMLKEQLQFMKKYSLHEAIKGLKHAIGMTELLESQS